MHLEKSIGIILMMYKQLQLNVCAVIEIKQISEISRDLEFQGHPSRLRIS